MTDGVSTERWHEYHSDPSLDMILESNDGVLFRASSYYLASASTVFANMKATANKPSPKPIPMDATAGVLDIFLNLVQSSQPALAGFDAEILYGLGDLCEKFDCEAIDRIVKEKLGFLAKDQPWQLFAAASHRDDVETARLALSHVTDLQGTPSLWDHLELARKDYAFAFLRHFTSYIPRQISFVTPYIHAPPVGDAYGRTTSNATWDSLIKTFDPSGSEKKQ